VFCYALSCCDAVCYVLLFLCYILLYVVVLCCAVLCLLCVVVFFVAFCYSLLCCIIVRCVSIWFVLFTCSEAATEQFVIYTSGNDTT